VGTDWGVSQAIELLIPNTVGNLTYIFQKWTESQTKKISIELTGHLKLTMNKDAQSHFLFAT
jgi:hypothetical protein